MLSKSGGKKGEKIVAFHWFHGCGKREILRSRIGAQGGRKEGQDRG